MFSCEVPWRRVLRTPSHPQDECPKLAGRSCWCAGTVFACQVLAIIQLDHVLGFFCMFKLLHVLVDRVVVFVCVVLPDVLYPDTLMAGCIVGCVARDACF